MVETEGSETKHFYIFGIFIITGLRVFLYLTLNVKILYHALINKHLYIGTLYSRCNNRYANVFWITDISKAFYSLLAKSDG